MTAKARKLLQEIRSMMDQVLASQRRTLAKMDERHAERLRADARKTLPNYRTTADQPRSDTEQTLPDPAQ